MKKVYIFDFDGTLVDSMPFWGGKMLTILNEQGVDYPDNIVSVFTPLGDLGTANYMRDVLGVTLLVDEILRRMDENATPKYRDEIPLKEGVYEYLKFLKEQGVSLNVLTASPHHMLDVCLQRLGVFDWFDHLFSCDDFGLTKAQTAIYHQALARIGASVEDAVFFDDNIGAVQTAKAAGLYTVGVADDSGALFRDELIETADAFIPTFEGMGLVETFSVRK